MLCSSFSLTAGDHEVMEEVRAMLMVTPLAKEKLRETLREHTADPHMAVRVVFDPSMPEQLELVLDREKQGDRIVAYEGGVKVLVIQSVLASQLEGFILDYEETLEDFTIIKVTRH